MRYQSFLNIDFVFKIFSKISAIYILFEQRMRGQGNFMLRKISFVTGAVQLSIGNILGRERI